MYPSIRIEYNMNIALEKCERWALKKVKYVVANGWCSGCKCFSGGKVKPNAATPALHRRALFIVWRNLFVIYTLRTASCFDVLMV